MTDDRNQPQASSDDTDMALPLAQDPAHDHDQLLVEAVQAGDGEALAELIHRNERWIRGVVYSVLSDADALDDVMQKVWLAVWQRCRQMDDVRRWRYWLYRLARNAAIDAGRRRQRQKNLWRRFREELLGGGRSGPPQPVRALSLKEQHQHVLAAVNAMPAIYKEPFVLRHLEGWTYRQIAQTLDLPVDTVGTRLVRARRLLQEQLGEQTPS